jgi:hypothetical protein
MCVQGGGMTKARIVTDRLILRKTTETKEEEITANKP